MRCDKMIDGKVCSKKMEEHGWKREEEGTLMIRYICSCGHEKWVPEEGEK